MTRLGCPSQSPAISEQIWLGMRRLEALEEGANASPHSPSWPPRELGCCWAGSVGGNKLAIEMGSDDQAGLGA